MARDTVCPQDVPNDKQIHQLVDPPSTVISGLSQGQVTGHKDEPVQPASVDLTIGGIFVPGTKNDEDGSAGYPLDSLMLEPGETAVVETSEVCQLPANIGAIGFPPATVSAKGLLTTNPGHVDPGYYGTLSFTVINMGSKAYPLECGAQIVSLMLFELSEPAVWPYDKRRDKQGPYGGVSGGRLNKLSPDFLDVGARALKAAEGAESKTRLWGLVVPVVVALVAFGGGYLTLVRANRDEIKTLQQDVKVLQNKLDVIDLKERIEKLEARK